MNALVKSVVSGFGFSLGAALFRQASKKLGLDDEKKKEAASKEAEKATTSESDDTEA